MRGPRGPPAGTTRPGARPTRTRRRRSPPPAGRSARDRAPGRSSRPAILRRESARRKMARPGRPAAGDRRTMFARFALLALLLAAAAFPAHAQKLETEEQKTIYALGLAVRSEERRVGREERW